MNIPSQIYLSLCGNTREIVYEYLTRQEWRYLKTIKKTNPSITIKAIIISEDKQADELIRYNPYIDIIEIHDASRILDTKTRDEKVEILNRQNFESLEKLIEESESEEISKKPKVYLTEKDIRKITKLTGRKKYIVTENEVTDFLDLPKQIGIKNIFIEKNQNIRILTELVSKADGFIGTYSPGYIIASIYRIKTILLISPNEKKYILDNYHRKNQKILCYTSREKKLDEKRSVEKRIINFFLPKEREKVLTKQERIEIEEVGKKISETTKIVFWVYGGFGDCLLAYINGGVGKYNRGGQGRCGKGSTKWTYLKSLKTKLPNIMTRAIVISGNSQSLKLMKNNPYIDETIYSPTLYKVNSIGQKIRNKIIALSGEYLDIDSVEGLSRIHNQIKNKIYLDDKSGIFFERTLEEAGENYILAHPFASTLLRCPVNAQEYIKLAKRIYEEVGYKTVVVGKDYTKKTVKSDGSIISKSTSETFDYESEFLINTVNKTDLLASSQLAINAVAIIGTWSCHTTNGLALNKPTVILTNKRSLSYLRPISRKRFPNALKRNLTFVTNKITEEVIDKTIRHLKKETK
jgi:hypothetical protein